MVEHVTITDPNIHEPKGASTAQDNQVYVADGAGSGDWTEVTPDNLVMVHSASDFPTAAAGVRTLAANTVYHVVGQVDIGSDRIVMSSNSVLRGTNQDYDEVVTSTTGVMITQTDVNARLIQIKLTCSSGTLFDIDGTGVESTSWVRVNAVCDTIGDVDNLDKVNIYKCVFDATSSGMTFTGAHGDLHTFDTIVDVATTNATCVDLGTATFDHPHFFNVEFINPSGTGFGLDVAAAGANINAGGIGIVANCTFSTSASATNYVEGDAGWEKLGTPDMLPTTSKAQGYVDGNGNANTFGGGTGVPEVVNFGTSFVADIQDKFTISTAGRFTYDGDSETVLSCQASARVTMAGGAARVRNLFFAKNGTEVASSISSKSLDGTNEGTYAVQSLITVSSGDYVELFIEAETATTSTTVDTASIMIHEVK